MTTRGVIVHDANDFPAPSSSEPHRLGELDQAPLTSDGSDAPPWWSSHDDDRHYEQLRLAHERRLDEEHRQWRRERFMRDFHDWRRQRGAPEPARPLGPWGAGLSSGDLSPSTSGDADLASDNGQTLFERS
jgi:hypothetical protein